MCLGSGSQGSSKLALSQYLVLPSHKEIVSTIIEMNGKGNDIASVGHDGNLKIYSLKDEKLTRSVSLSNLPLSSCVFYKTTSQQNILVASSWDNTLIFYDLEFGKVIYVLLGHDDAVSSLSWSPLRNILISGSWDCTIKVWHAYEPGGKCRIQDRLVAQLDHDSKITCLKISR